MIAAEMIEAVEAHLPKGDLAAPRLRWKIACAEDAIGYKERILNLNYKIRQARQRLAELQAEHDALITAGFGGHGPIDSIMLVRQRLAELESERGQYARYLAEAVDEALSGRVISWEERLTR